MKILFLVPYPTGEAPSQRFRFEQYYELLRNNNIEYSISPFWDMKTWKIMYRKGFLFSKILGMIKGFIRRKMDLFTLYKYDLVFIHRELTPAGPPLIEWLIAKVFRKKIIYDFDDAIWVPNVSDTNRFFSFIKSFSAVSKLCRWSYRVSCGNEYLCNYAREFNKNAVYNPTTIDTDNYHNRVKDHNNSEKIIFGWTGTHSTIRYLEDLVPIISELEEKYDFGFYIISDRKPEFSFKSLIYKQWNKEEEINDLLLFNVGLMPLTNDTWSNGKCGFKALQYMALGIPALVSPVGVSTIIVDHGVNGFICRSKEEWKIYMIKLITDRQLLIELTQKTREKIISNYSVISNSANFLDLLS
ncbi:MAG: glycosyltransferase family 1 protein [Bacteroidota bacterium]